jgi:hypothetical protein
MEGAFCFHEEVDAAVHHKSDETEEGNEDRVGVEESGEAAF